jgi:uncharacterized beta-barrel protein YwiB (DUF1934 family)
MKIPILLSIKGSQTYADQEPDTIELVTDGTLEYRDGGWDLCYEESALTGLDGVTTTFRVESGRIVLDRTGKLRSQMVFEEGVSHDSLYQMEFGALHLTVCAERIWAQISPAGGVIDLVYSIQVEHDVAGKIDYHLDISAK